MTTSLLAKTDTGTRPLLLLIAFQCLCTVIFVGDVRGDASSLGIAALIDPHLLPELGAAVGLVVGIVFELRDLIRLLRR